MRNRMMKPHKRLAADPKRWRIIYTARIDDAIWHYAQDLEYQDLPDMAVISDIDGGGYYPDMMTDDWASAPDYKRPWEFFRDHMAREARLKEGQQVSEIIK